MVPNAAVFFVVRRATYVAVGFVVRRATVSVTYASEARVKID
jgi:hypothetical protein